MIGSTGETAALEYFTEDWACYFTIGFENTIFCHKQSSAIWLQAEYFFHIHWSPFLNQFSSFIYAAHFKSNKGIHTQSTLHKNKFQQNYKKLHIISGKGWQTKHSKMQIYQM